EDTGGAQGVDLAIVEGGRRPRTGAGHRLEEALLVLVDPHLGAGVDVVADNDLIHPALLLGPGPVADDGERAPARPDAVLPQLLGRVVVPGRRDADACPPAVAVRAAEAGPVGRLQRGHRPRIGFRLLAAPLREILIFARGLPAPPEGHLGHAAVEA